MTGVGGSLYGLAYGDAMGAPTEFRSILEEGGTLVPGRFEPRARGRFLQWWHSLTSQWGGPRR